MVADRKDRVAVDTGFTVRFVTRRFCHRHVLEVTNDYSFNHITLVFMIFNLKGQLRTNQILGNMTSQRQSTGRTRKMI